MTARALITGLALWLGLAGASLAGTEPAHLRAISLMPDAETVTVHIAGKTGSVDWMLRREEATEYRTLPPGEYRVEVEAGGETLIEARYGLGAGDHYTFALFGLAGARSGPADTSWKSRLTRAFGGVEAAVKLGYAAQGRMLLDRTRKSAKTATVRVLHAAPGAAEYALTARRGAKSNRLAKEAYAHLSSGEDLAAGDWTVRAAIGGSETGVQSQELTAKPATLITLFLTGGPDEGQKVHIVPLVYSGE